MYAEKIARVNKANYLAHGTQ
jgi:translation initiation factor 3 subunit D